MFMITSIKNYSYIKYNNINNKTAILKTFNTLSKDTFELKKKSSPSFYGIKSFLREIQAIEQDRNLAIKIIQEEYEKLSAQIAKEFEEQGLTFQKPKLEFKKLPDDINADYHIWDNTIVINSKKSSLNKWYKSDDFIGYFSSLEQKEKQSKSNIKQASIEEFRLIMNSILTHEFQHAKQIQTILHLKGAKNLFIKTIQTLYKLPDEEVRRLFSFVFEFEPKKEIEPDKKAVFQNVGLKKGELDCVDFENLLELDNGSCILFFEPETILSSMIKVNKSYEEYITNLSELDAFIAEYLAVKNGEFEGVDENTIQNFTKAKRNRVKRIFYLIYSKQNV